MALSNLLSRQSGGNIFDNPNADEGGGAGGATGANALLNLISNPFSTQLQTTSFYASFAATSAAFLLLGFLFCFLRPRTNAVYAPRAKHADEKHAPPQLNNGLFSWIGPTHFIKEDDLVDKVGLDATIFLRFLSMLRNIFLVLTVLGCAIIIPINLGGPHIYSEWHQVTVFIKFTPQYSTGPRFWAFTICAYLFDIVVFGFIWWNYRAVLRLRRNYFRSAHYQASLHSRTLIMRHIPESFRTDQGITRIIDETGVTHDQPMTAIARNVRDLPELIEEYEETVQNLESVLAKFLKNPNKIPTSRPTCKPSKKDKARKDTREIDAIDYYSSRIRELEMEITQVRGSVDQRNPLPYGFASYTHVEDAHAVAYATRKRAPETTEIRLAPKPSDLIWKNLPLSRSTRRRKKIWTTTWMTLLTVLYIIPNMLTAIFLSDFQNLGQVWPWFQRSLEKHPHFWGILSGILAPTIQTLFYVAMPIVFRRMLNTAGDVTKTSRERHVMSRLYIFFIFNNLIVFNIFSSLFRFVAGIISAHKAGQHDVFEAIKQGHVFQHIVTGLCQSSTFWITWQLTRNFGVALDIVQYWPLIFGSIMRRFGNPTPRQLIKLSAPPPLDYASYYNNYLFAATVGLCFSTVQPLILPATALYLGLDAWLKRYTMLYVAITKTESGGLFWRVIINRLLFAVFLGNCTIALIVGGQGLMNVSLKSSLFAMLYALVPLPFILWAFKYYLARTFDGRLIYYTTKTISDLEGQPSATGKPLRKNERVGVKFGNPALYKRLMTPMVAAKSRHLLAQVYTGRMEPELDFDGSSIHHGPHGASAESGYSDVYMRDMSSSTPGKGAAMASTAPFEIVPESAMAFEHFKKRDEFREEFGGDGELYGRADDERSSRHSSVSSFALLAAANQQPPNATTGGTTYARGYNRPGAGPGPIDEGDISLQGHPAFRSGDDARGRLTQQAAPMGRTGTNSPGPYNYNYNANEPYDPYSRPGTPGAGGLGPGGNGGYREGLTPNLTRDESPGGAAGGSYDYFRGGARGARRGY